MTESGMIEYLSWSVKNVRDWDNYKKRKEEYFVIDSKGNNLYKLDKFFKPETLIKNLLPKNTKKKLIIKKKIFGKSDYSSAAN